jgi:hypothetical protein
MPPVPFRCGWAVHSDSVILNAEPKMRRNPCQPAESAI